MYCKYCGKYVLGNRDVCDDCIAKQNTTSQHSQSQYAQNTPNKMPSTTKEGFGKGLASTILSEASIIIWYISILFLFSSGASFKPSTPSLQPNDAAGITFLIFGILFTLITLAANVIALIFGTQSVNKFKEARKNYLPKPVLAFVFGLIGQLSALVVLTITTIFNFITISLILA